MELADLFPEGDRQTIPASMRGYHPNHYITAQMCHLCGAWVAAGFTLADGTNPTDMRPVHYDYHELVNGALGLS